MTSRAAIGKPAAVAPVGDWCGEGPVWHAGEQALYWVDINRFLIHRYHAASAAVQTWFFEEPVTALALTQRANTLAATLASRVILWKPVDDERRDQGFRLENWPAVRLNDARPDPRGSFWVGSMRNNVNPDGTAGEAGGTDGALYRIDPNGAVTKWKSAVGIGNTLAWSPDGQRFYFADTLRNSIFVYDYDPTTGAISRERPFFTGFDRGLPDGSAVDRDGCLWNCRHGGGCIVRIAPDGQIECVIEMPVSNITSCTFGGPELKTVYVTTAALGAAGERLGGSLFALESEIPGLPENRFQVAL